MTTTLRTPFIAACLATSLAGLGATAAAAQGAPAGTALPEAPAGQALATADLKSPDGQSMGSAAFVETADGVLIQVRLENVPPGAHGLHIHENGACEPPDFSSAGGHYNPGGEEHGYMRPQGHHAGDLPNIMAGADGHADADILTSAISLGTGQATLFPDGGTALVLHSGPDDYRTNPSGASGNRIACGTIQRSTQAQ